MSAALWSAWDRANDADHAGDADREAWLDVMALVEQLPEAEQAEQGQPAIQWGLSRGWLDADRLDESIAEVIAERAPAS